MKGIKLPEPNAKNKEEINAILRRVQAGRNASQSTITNYTRVLKTLANFLESLGKTISTASKDDLMDFSLKFKEGRVQSSWAVTMATVKTSYRLFYDMGKHCYPDQVRWLQIGKIEAEHHLEPKDLWQPDEIEKLVVAAGTPRNMAFVKVLAESGCRISEVLNLRFADIDLSPVDAHITIKKRENLKTRGSKRVIKLYSALPELRNWVAASPNRDNMEVKVFDITADTARWILRQAAKKVGINKPCHPHAFRHARTVWLKKRKVDPIYTMRIMGWSSLDMYNRVYGHVDQEDVDGAIDEANGVKREAKEEVKPITRTMTKCKCGQELGLTSKFCSNCGSNLSRAEELRMLRHIENNDFKMMADVTKREQKLRNEFEQRISDLEDRLTQTVEQQGLQEQYWEMQKAGVIPIRKPTETENKAS